MGDRTERLRGEKGPSAHYLVLIFLACVAVCAVFFSLGFVVGHNQPSTQASQMSPVTENVAPSGNDNIPPTVNVPAGNPNVPAPVDGGSAIDGSSSPATLHPQPLQKSPSEAMEPLVSTNPGSSTAHSAVQKPPDPSKTRAPSPVKKSQSSHFAVQVMASRTRADAIRVIGMLKSRGYHGVLVSPSGSRQGNALYRVQVGPYASREQAEKIRSGLKKEGFKAFIVTR
ncbi:MAG TPA: SPOR domain-containing protein [Terriglobia bacterium]|nr:SPOR domain-containing protein [Terriglobia bacterium]